MNATNPTSDQPFNGFLISIVKDNLGNRFAGFKSKTGRKLHLVPVSVCGLAAGKDAWMRDIKVRCNECREVTTCGKLQDGEYCETCVQKFEQENAELDAS